jgi:cation diffusion facilitator CzcD-associated flavoprotein CzcO
VTESDPREISSCIVSAGNDFFHTRRQQMTDLPPPSTGAAQDPTSRPGSAGETILEALVIGAGVEDFLVLEKGSEPGGVWRDNTYPGAACDVPSHLYSFSFAPNPDWSHTFARQGEIHAYLQGCVRRFALARHIRHGAKVAGACFDEARALWEVRLRSGECLLARLLVSATGLLSRPLPPRLPGIDSLP